MALPHFYYHRSTPRGEGGIALFELYGLQAEETLRALFRPRRGALPGAGRACLGEVTDPRGEVLDEAVVTRVPAAGMWSRLDAWTVGVHGGPWIQGKLEQTMTERGGSPLDTAGVLRLALSAGVLDAVQAGAYELLLLAQTEKASRFFLRQYQGELSARLREIFALVEARMTEQGLLALRALEACAEPAYRLGHPLRVLLAGPPNAGKSTLFNRLVGEERAVVASLAGTTRDSIEELIAIEGFPVLFMDSAGIRALAGAGEVEVKGIRKVLEKLEGAAVDGILYLVAPPWRLSAEDRGFISRLKRDRCLLLAAMADLEPPDAALALNPDLRLSAKTGKGLETLRTLILQCWLRQDLPGDVEVPCAPFTRSQRILVSAALADLAAGQPDLDAARSTLLKCLQSSWPEEEGQVLFPGAPPPDVT